MYETYFGFAAAPFSIAPDPRYLYMSHRHQEALATLLYGLRGDGGFVLLTGEVGAGKTTLCRCLLEQIPDTCDVAYLFNPNLTVVELLSTICDEFGIAYSPQTQSTKRFINLINQYLLESHARGRRAVLIVDEAQNLSPAVLEQIRLLTNLETNECKLLQILLLGQPELAEMLGRTELRQLAQRVVARYHLTPLDKPEVAAYVRHRLDVAGAHSALFPDAIMGRLHKLSGGVPRVINVLCDRALLGTFVQHKERVDGAILLQAAREVLPPPTQRTLGWRRAALAGAAAALAGMGVMFANQENRQDTAIATTQTAPAAVHDRGASLHAAPVAAASPLRPPARHIVKAPSAPATPAAPMLALPPDVSPAQSLPLAYATLFHKWRATYHEGADPCLQAAAQGMQCRTLRGGVDDLRRLNAPVILHLTDAQDHPFYAALTELGPQSATFSFGAQTRKASLASLVRQWRGEYTVLRPVPQGLGQPSREASFASYPGATPMRTAPMAVATRHSVPAPGEGE